MVEGSLVLYSAAFSQSRSYICFIHIYIHTHIYIHIYTHTLYTHHTHIYIVRTWLVKTEPVFFTQDWGNRLSRGPFSMVALYVCLARRNQRGGFSSTWGSLTSGLLKTHFSANSVKESDLANKYYFDIAPNKLGNIVGDGEAVERGVVSASLL